MKDQPIVCDKKKQSSKNVALVGRQSIYDRELNTLAYEVIYRASDPFDASETIAEFMFNTFSDIGLENIVGQKRAFIQVAEKFFDDIPWSKDSVAIEVFSDVTPALEMMQGLQALKFKGYSIVLAGFSFTEEQMLLLPLVDIIKIDLAGTNRVELKAQLGALKKKSDVKLLAMKIETLKELEFCKGLGFDYFQGCFLDEPKVIKDQNIAPNKIAILQLVNRLQAPSIEIEELDELIKTDVSLSYRILKYINSSSFQLGGEVTSINQALLLLGIKNLKTWMSLIVLSGLSDKPLDVTQKTLVRAKMCELIAEIIKQKNKDDYFLVGMFSLLDVMLSQSMTRVLEIMSIRQELKDALLKHEHKEGKVLKLVIAYEQGAWQDMRSGTITPKSLRSAYLTSIRWADEAMTGLGAS